MQYNIDESHVIHNYFIVTTVDTFSKYYAHYTILYLYYFNILFVLLFSVRHMYYSNVSVHFYEKS